MKYPVYIRGLKSIRARSGHDRRAGGQGDCIHHGHFGNGSKIKHGTTTLLFSVQTHAKDMCSENCTRASK